MTELDILSKTLYLEARGEPEEGIRWVAWVIKNRAKKNRSYWGGSNIADVCLQRSADGTYQFECWKFHDPCTVIISEVTAYNICRRIADEVLREDNDPTGGCDHYNNPEIESGERTPGWVTNCVEVRKIENHQFYREK